MPASKRSGFTLIELSIVLVIIGLIVGGVLVGQDLIKAAQVRSTVGQIEKYNAALNTFCSKYNGMPGDIVSTSAANFGMAARSGASGHGDGDGMLEGCSAGATGAATLAGCETVLFFADLSYANLIDGSYTTATDALATVAAGSQASYIPSAKLGKGTYIVDYADSGLNYFEVTGVVSTAAGVYTTSNLVTPNEALNMDNKIDDGAPLTGQVTATEGTTGPDVTAVAGSAACVFTGGKQYNTTTTALSNTPLCHVRFRMN